mgnify:CR=1 FL=1
MRQEKTDANPAILQFILWPYFILEIGLGSGASEVKDIDTGN